MAKQQKNQVGGLTIYSQTLVTTGAVWRQFCRHFAGCRPLLESYRGTKKKKKEKQKVEGETEKETEREGGALISENI